VNRLTSRRNIAQHENCGRRGSAIAFVDSVQFGRRIIRFQAIQQQLPLLAGEVPPRAGLAADDRFGEVLAETILYALCWTLSGCMCEILRGIIARGLGPR